MAPARPSPPAWREPTTGAATSLAPVGEYRAAMACESERATFRHRAVTPMQPARPAASRRIDVPNTIVATVLNVRWKRPIGSAESGNARRSRRRPRGAPTEAAERGRRQGRWPPQRSIRQVNEAGPKTRNRSGRRLAGRYRDCFPDHRRRPTAYPRFARRGIAGYRGGWPLPCSKCFHPTGRRPSIPRLVVCGVTTMRFRVLKFAHVLERLGLAMAGAACGLFVGALVGVEFRAADLPGFPALHDDRRRRGVLPHGIDTHLCLFIHKRSAFTRRHRSQNRSAGNFLSAVGTFLATLTALLRSA